MADQSNYPQANYPHGQDQSRGSSSGGMMKNISGSQIMAVVTLFPLGGLLLLLAGITLTGTLIGLAVATPLFVIFSPVLIPAVLTIGLAVTGFLTSGAFGITALSSLSWIVNYLRQAGGSAAGGDPIEMAKQRVQGTAGYVGQKVRDVGQKTQEAAGRT